MVAHTAAVFFDVDFTLIHPGPRFQGSGYRDSCARYGVQVDAGRFEAAVAGAADVLDTAGHVYDADLYLRYTQRIIELMGGTAPGLEAVAQELYDEWAQHHHFHLYDDTLETLRTLAARGLRLGLISNSHRCLVSFQSHFALDGLIATAVSSSKYGCMKPHPAIFRAALDAMGIEAEQAAMVGDSLTHDVHGARQIGMRGILLARGPRPAPPMDDVEVIHSLRALTEIL